MSRCDRSALRAGPASVLLVMIVVLMVVLVAACGRAGSSGSPEGADGGTDPHSGLPWVAASALPAEVRHTLDLIDAGGPYPYPEHDDQTFGNYEGILPKETRGYYREYTVETPGSDDRGARRIIKGAGGELYYTDDHYASFSRIRR